MASGETLRNGDSTLHFLTVPTVSSPRIQAAGEKFERQLYDLLGPETPGYIRARHARDGKSFHISLFNTGEYDRALDREVQWVQRDNPKLSPTAARQLAQKRLDDKFQYTPLPMDGRFLGIGHAASGGNEVYFVVVSWPGGEKFREAFGLDPHGKDFHVTLGFSGGDIHGVPKNRGTLIAQAANLSMSPLPVNSPSGFYLMHKSAHAFRHALTVRNVVARTRLAMDKTAMEFPTEDALKTYMHEHPAANPANHTVSKGGHPAGPGDKGEKDEGKKDDDGGSEEHKTGLKPGTLKEDPWKYFNDIPGTVLIPIDDIETIRARPTGIENAEVHMQKAFEGEGKRRDPIDISPLPGGGWRVEDGNSTTAIARKHGWKFLPAFKVPTGEPRKKPKPH
jgi:hypothetical protein